MEIQTQGPASIVTLIGELDLASSGALEREFEAALTPETDQVIIDLRPLEFMDSTGLSVIVKAHQRAEEAGTRFGVVKGSAQVQRLLSLTGVADRLTVVDTPEELLAGS